MHVFRLFVCVSCLFLCSSARATSLILSDVPESLSADDSFTVTASFSGSKSSCGSKTYLLRGVLYQNSGDDLFGYTKNNLDEWIAPSETSAKFFAFTTSEEGTWSGQLVLRGDHGAGGFKGQGTYQVRLDRYTQTGTSKAESSNSIPITLLFTPPPTPTPTPTPSPTPTPTTTPTPSTSSGPTATPTPLASIKPSTTPKVSPTPFPQFIIEIATSSPSPPDSKILGASDEVIHQSSSRFIPGLIVLGGLCLVAGGLSLGIAYLGKNPD